MEDIQKQFDDYSKSIRLIESMLKNSKEQMAKLHQQFDEIYKDSKPEKLSKALATFSKKSLPSPIALESSTDTEKDIRRSNYAAKNLDVPQNDGDDPKKRRSIIKEASVQKSIRTSVNIPQVVINNTVDHEKEKMYQESQQQKESDKDPSKIRNGLKNERSLAAEASKSSQCYTDENVSFIFKFFSNKIFKESALSTSTKASMSMLRLGCDGSSIIFHPHSVAVQVWNSFYTLLMYILLIAIPLSIAFDITCGDMLIPLSLVNLVFIGLDMLIKYHTGILINQQMECDLKTIRTFHFKRGWWILNVLSAFPWVFVVDAISSANGSKRIGLRTVCAINACGILETMFGPDRLGIVEEKFTQISRIRGWNASMIDSIVVMISMIFYWHFNACSVMILRETHISHQPEFYESEWAHYSAAVFSAAGEMLANGWGSEIPTTTLDRWLKVINMMISAVFLALFIGNISALMIGLDSSGKRFNEILEEVNQYINYKGFGENLKSRILKYYQFKYSGGKFFNENRILSELNQPLRQYIALRECQDLIIKVPFFKDADKYFITQVVMILKVHHYLPGDYIIEEGTYGDHMYFIATGSVEAIVNGVARAKLSPGSFFGEIALLFGRMKRTASIRANNYCILYSLSRADLNTILELNPHMAEKMKTVASERLANDAKNKAEQK